MHELKLKKLCMYLFFILIWREIALYTNTVIEARSVEKKVLKPGV